MKSGLPAAAIVLILLGGIALAVAQTGGLGPPDTAWHLTPQQRASIYQTVIKEKLRTPPPPNMPVTVGEQIPPVTELYALPDPVLAESPSAKFYKYTIAQNQVVIVDPTNLKVIDVIRP
jgi:hypothetical protein